MDIRLTKFKPNMSKHTINEVHETEVGPPTKHQKLLIEIPTDIFSIVMRFLHAPDIYSMMLACKDFYEIGQHIITHEPTQSMIKSAIAYKNTRYIVKIMRIGGDLHYEYNEYPLMKIMKYLARSPDFLGSRLIKLIDKMELMTRNRIVAKLNNKRGWKHMKLDVVAHYCMGIRDDELFQSIKDVPHHHKHAAKIIEQFDAKRIGYAYCGVCDKWRLSMFFNYNVFETQIIANFSRILIHQVNSNNSSYVDRLIQLGLHNKLTFPSTDRWYCSDILDSSSGWQIIEHFANAKLLETNHSSVSTLLRTTNYIFIVIKYTFDVLINMNIDIVLMILNREAINYTPELALRTLITHPEFHKLPITDKMLRSHVSSAFNCGLIRVLLLNERYKNFVESSIKDI